MTFYLLSDTFPYLYIQRLFKSFLLSILKGMSMKEMTKQDLNRVSAMILNGVEWDENYQPKFAVDCFLDCESDNAVKVLWMGDYEFSLWDPLEDWKHLGEIIQEFGIVLVPVNNDNNYYTKYESKIPCWKAVYPTFVGEDPYGFSCMVVDFDFTSYNPVSDERESYLLYSINESPNEAVLQVILKASPLISK